jgi:hypothetical protein
MLATATAVSNSLHMQQYNWNWRQRSHDPSSIQSFPLAGRDPNANVHDVASANGHGVVDRSVYPPRSRVVTRYPQSIRGLHKSYPRGRWQAKQRSKVPAGMKSTNVKLRRSEQVSFQSGTIPRTEIKNGYGSRRNAGLPPRTSPDAYTHGEGLANPSSKLVDSINTGYLHYSPSTTNQSRDDNVPNKSSASVSYSSSYSQDYHHQQQSIYSTRPGQVNHGILGQYPYQEPQQYRYHHHNQHYSSDDSFHPSLTSPVYTVSSPVFCDNTPAADFSPFVTESDGDNNNNDNNNQSQTRPIQALVGDVSGIKRILDMISMKEAMNRILAKNRLVRQKDATTSSRDDFSEKNRETRLCIGNTAFASPRPDEGMISPLFSCSAGTAGRSRLEYDPRQPQYSPEYDPDPFRNDREYSPFFPGWYD